MENGTLIYPNSNNNNNNNNNIYSLFVSYFNNPVMTKLSYDKDTNMSYYYVKKATQLLNMNQYIIFSNEKEGY